MAAAASGSPATCGWRTNGGFIQMALDLAIEGQPLDASSCAGVLLVARGNGESYGVHLRTPDCLRPWQSYRAGFVAAPEWREIRLPFERFEGQPDSPPLRRSNKTSPIG